jgi:hypothetical protein
MNGSLKDSLLYEREKENEVSVMDLQLAENPVYRKYTKEGSEQQLQLKNLLYRMNIFWK